MHLFQLTLRALAVLAAALGFAAAAHAAPTMSLGAAAMAPAAFVDFCRRQPQDCGPDADAVRAGVAQAMAERAELLGQPVKAAVTAAIPTPRREDIPASLTPGLWRKLNDVNARVNRAIRPRADGGDEAADRWSTPLAEGGDAGDCEDYVLEKIRALVAAGVPRSALNITLATTSWGENHAVLAVSTRDGDFILDNLSPLVRRWDAVNYRFNARQVAGQAFVWARVTSGARLAAQAAAVAPGAIAAR